MTPSEDAREILRRHTELSADKVLSYLPINTIRKVLGLSLEAYMALAEANGARCLIFNEHECCISSGALYAFLPEPLGRVLERNRKVLAKAGIPCEPDGFIRVIATAWFEAESDMIPLLQELFGEA